MKFGGFCCNRGETLLESNAVSYFCHVACDECPVVLRMANLTAFAGGDRVTSRTISAVKVWWALNAGRLCRLKGFGEFDDALVDCLGKYPMSKR